MSRPLRLIEPTRFIDRPVYLSVCLPFLKMPALLKIAQLMREVRKLPDEVLSMAWSIKIRSVTSPLGRATCWPAWHPVLAHSVTQGTCSLVFSRALLKSGPVEDICSWTPLFCFLVKSGTLVLMSFVCLAGPVSGFVERDTIFLLGSRDSPTRSKSCKHDRGIGHILRSTNGTGNSTIAHICWISGNIHHLANMTVPICNSLLGFCLDTITPTRHLRVHGWVLALITGFPRVSHERERLQVLLVLLIDGLPVLGFRHRLAWLVHIAVSSSVGLWETSIIGGVAVGTAQGSFHSVAEGHVWSCDSSCGFGGNY